MKRVGEYPRICGETRRSTTDLWTRQRAPSVNRLPIASPTESDRGASNGSAPSNDGAPKLSDIEIPLESAIESNVLHGVGQPSSSTFLGILKKFSPWSKPASADRKDVAEVRAEQL